MFSLRSAQAKELCVPACCMPGEIMRIHLIAQSLFNRFFPLFHFLLTTLDEPTSVGEPVSGGIGVCAYAHKRQDAAMGERLRGRLGRISHDGDAITGATASPRTDTLIYHRRRSRSHPSNNSTPTLPTPLPLHACGLPRHILEDMPSRPVLRPRSWITRARMPALKPAPIKWLRNLALLLQPLVDRDFSRRCTANTRHAPSPLSILSLPSHHALKPRLKDPLPRQNRADRDKNAASLRLSRTISNPRLNPRHQ